MLEKQCKRCNEWKPTSDFHKWARSKDGLNDWCRPCRKAHDAATVIQRKAYYEQWYAKAESKALVAANSKEWKADNRDRKNELNRLSRRRSYIRNPERAKAHVRRHYLANREAAYARAKAYRARRKNAPINDFTAAQWQEVLQTFNFHCAYCLKPFSSELPSTQDHMQPLSKGGSHTIANIVPACLSCNSRKRTLTLAEWVAKQDGGLVYLAA